MKTKTEKLFQVLPFEIKAIDENAKTVTALVSTKKVDRDGDVILPAAFKDRLKHYKDHPVFLVNHRYTVEDTIGEATSVKITDDGLECTFKYYVGQGNPRADWAWTLAQNGMAAFSVGFIGYDWEPIVDKETQYTVGRTFTDVELIEVSQVAVPSNRGALQSSRSIAEAEAKLCLAVEKGFKDGKLKELPTACGCTFEAEQRQSVLVGDLCGTCKLPLTDEQKAAVKANKEADDAAAVKAAEDAKAAEAAAKQVSDDAEAEHYFGTVLEHGAKAPEMSPDNMVSMLAGTLSQAIK